MGVMDAVPGIKIEAEMPLVQEPEAEDPVADGHRECQGQAGQGPAHLGHAALDREIPAGDEQDDDQHERESGFLDIQAFHEMENDREPGQKQDQEESALFALVDIDRGDDQGEPQEQGQKSGDMEELQGEDVLKEGLGFTKFLSQDIKNVDDSAAQGRKRRQDDEIVTELF